MWSKKSKPSTKPRPKSGAADTLVTMDTKITGDVSFSGVLFVDGHIKGNVSSTEGNHSLLTIGANGHVEGEIKVPQVVIYGYVKGDVHTAEHLNLQKESRIEGNVYYNLLEMAMGASVNGKLIKKATARKLLNHNPETEDSAEEEIDDLQSTLDGS